VTEPSALEQLYRDAVLEHYRRPRNRTPLAAPDARALVQNPVCGDQVRVELELADGRAQEIAAISRGCSIAVASGSLMTECARGRTEAEIAKWHASLRALVEGEGEVGELPEALRVFERVRDLPSRRRCALLAWEALEAAFEQARAAAPLHRIV